MPAGAYGRLATRLTILKLRRSPAAIGAALGLPALVAFVWAKETYVAGLGVYLYLLPHVFLVATQNMFKGEAAGGALENVLFICGGFKSYLLRKIMVLSLTGCGYGLLLFALLWVAGPGAFVPGSGELQRLAVSLLAGIYYIAFGGLLGHFLEAGSNVLALIIAQAAALIGLLADAANGSRLLESLSSGTFSGLGERLKFVALAGVLPNLLVADSLRRFALWLAPAAAALFLLQALIIRGSEWRGR